MILSLVCSSAAFRPLLSFCKLEGNFVLCHNFNDHNIYINCTANIYSGITVEVHLNHCTFERLQIFFIVNHSSLYCLQIRNCNFCTIFHVIYFAWN